MRTRTGLFAIASAALLLTPALVQAGGPGGGGGGGQAQRPAQVVRGQQDMQRDRARDRDQTTTPDRDRDRARDQDRIHVPDTANVGNEKIYGSKLMTEQERQEFQERLRKTDAGSKGRTELLAQHREEMQKRAKAQGVELDED
jgi:hypothetical protein